MTRNEIYNYAISKGCSNEKAVELSLAHEGKRASEVIDVVAEALLVPVAVGAIAAVAVDDALGGIPSAAVGAAATVGLGIFDIFF